MLIDFSRAINKLDGTPNVGVDERGNPWSFATLREVAVQALSAVFPGDENVPLLVKYDRGRLAMKIWDSTGPLEVSTEQAADLKKLIGRVFGNLIVARACDIIEGSKVTPPPEPEK